MSLIPKEKKFFDLFEAQGQIVVEVANLLKGVQQNYKEISNLALRFKELENEGDRIVEQIVRLLEKSFITPLDRQDIKSLAHDNDSVIDEIERAINRMSIFGIYPLPQAAVEFFQIIEQAVSKINLSLRSLRDLRKKDKDILRWCSEINTLESKSDDLHRETLKSLMKDEPKDVLELDRRWKTKEIFQTLEETMDICEDVANSLVTIVLTNR